ncbi:MAG: ATP-dependent helicase HelY [Pyrinomonadaceae bacterium]|jgi:superfamily II RNA helicase|nr:ATP-dependent helicase HelY [Pyrinomonadaceae bacterium]
MKLSMPEMPPATLLTALGSYNLLPAIVFLPTRRRCDQAASEAAFLRRDPSDPRREQRRDLLRSFVEQYPEIRSHRHWETIVRGGVAAHHAGHMPAWKLVIEKMMSAGFLDAIFATATVAAGVDFPARTVVLSGAEARTGNGWRQLTASELQQMTGRAGRRGRDNVGFIVAAPGLHQDPERIATLLRSPPDPLVSQFRATYNTLLNLLDAYGNFAQVREIAEKSFAHREAAGQIIALEKVIVETGQRIELKLREANCELSVNDVRGFERLVSARTQLLDSKPQSRAEVLHRWLDEVVQSGRVVAIGRSGKRLVMVTEKRDGNVRGLREDGRSASFALERIGRVYSPFYRLKEELIEEAFEEIRRRGKELVIAEPRLRDAQDEESGALNLLDELIDKIIPPEIIEQKRQSCAEALWGLLSAAEDLERATRRTENIREQVWQPFAQRARVLSSFGYLDFEAEKVTERGSWLADLHIDRPLIIGEALQAGLFTSLDFVRTAAIVAALTADDDRDYGALELEDALVNSLAQFEEIGFRVSSEEWKAGVEPTPELNFSAAATAARWASGTEWTTLVRETRAEEGDLFRMLSRTGEALLQVAGLRKAHPEAARISAIAADAILREPVR